MADVVTTVVLDSAVESQIEYYVDKVFFDVRDHALRTSKDLDVAWVILTGEFKLCFMQDHTNRHVYKVFSLPSVLLSDVLQGTTGALFNFGRESVVYATAPR